MMRMIFVGLMAGLFLMSCHRNNGPGDPCLNAFEPYPDLITGRVVTRAQSLLLKGMEHYRIGDHEKAAIDLEHYLATPSRTKVAHLYLANSYLALGRPYDAELQLDLLENSNEQGFADQVEWYTVVCWVCSGQKERALEGARQIVEGRRHTYKSEARDLLGMLAPEKE